jgi:hypothetical protein
MRPILNLKLFHGKQNKDSKIEINFYKPYILFKRIGATPYKWEKIPKNLLTKDVT